MLAPERLAAWMRLHDRRRAGSVRMARVAVLAAVLIGGGAAVGLWRRSEDLGSALGLWTSLLVAAVVLSFVTTPFRLFWSPDADALARFPIPGRALYRLGVRRNLRVGGVLALSPLLALGFALAVEPPALALRLLAVWAAGVVAALALAPGIALGAGALAASERAEAITKSFGGEFQAPRGAYLGLVPGVACAGVVLALIAATPWARGESSAGWLGLVLLSVAAVLAAWLGDARADAVMPGAVRELGALNRRRLAHVDATKLSVVEGLLVAAVPARSRALLAKDLRMLRRRHPAYFLLQAILVIGAWIVAWSESELRVWLPAAIAVLHAYSVVMMVRATRPPVEIPALLNRLPMTAGDVRVTKLAPLFLRTLLISGLMGGALARATTLASAGVIAGSAALAALVIGALLISRDDDRATISDD